MKTYSVRKWVNTLLFVLTIIGIFCILLPWYHIHGYASGRIAGFSSSISSNSGSVIGLLTWAGFFSLGLLIYEIYLLRKKIITPFILSFIPPILILFFIIVFITSLDSVKSSYTVSGDGYGGSGGGSVKPDAGMLLLIFISILMLLFTLFRRKKIKAIAASVENSNSIITNNEAASISTLIQPLEPQVVASKPIEVKPKQEIKIETRFVSDTKKPISFAKEKSGTSLSKITLIVVGAILLASAVYYIKNKSSEETKQASEQSIINEKERLQAIISQVNELVAQKNYDGALLQTNNINWIYEPGVHNDYVEQYNSHRANLKQTIAELKSEKVASEKSIVTNNATENSDSITQLIKETMSENNYSFPYFATAIVDEAHFYKSPDVNTMRNAYIIKGQEIKVNKEEGEFIYAEFDINGKVTEGWMLKNDFEKHNY